MKRAGTAVIPKIGYFSTAPPPGSTCESNEGMGRNFPLNDEVEEQNKGCAEEDMDVCTHAAILALRIERSFGMIIDNRG